MVNRMKWIMRAPRLARKAMNARREANRLPRQWERRAVRRDRKDMPGRVSWGTWVDEADENELCRRGDCRFRMEVVPGMNTGGKRDSEEETEGGKEGHQEEGMGGCKSRGWKGKEKTKG